MLEDALLQLREVAVFVAVPAGTLRITKRQDRDGVHHLSLGKDLRTMTGRHHTDKPASQVNGQMVSSIGRRVGHKQRGAGVVDGLLGAVLNPDDLPRVIEPGGDIAGLRSALSFILFKSQPMLAEALSSEG